MDNLNSVLIEGNLIKDPVGITTSNDVSVCRFTIASVREKYYDGKKKKKITEVDIEVSGKEADRCAELLKKGRGVRATGNLQQKIDGGISVFAEHVEFKPRHIDKRDVTDE